MRHLTILFILGASSILAAADSGKLSFERFMQYAKKEANYIKDQKGEYVFESLMRGAGHSVQYDRNYEVLSPVDGEMDANYTPPGMPQLPINSCKATSRGREGVSCLECFKKAQNELNAVRRAFEQLRRINSFTQSFTAKSLAFGDGVSGIHGAAALAWQNERSGIEHSLQVFNGQYDNKYSELAKLLLADLQMIARCENVYFDDRDWYDRFGFMYYHFMTDRYRR